MDHSVSVSNRFLVDLMGHRLCNLILGKDCQFMVVVDSRNLKDRARMQAAFTGGGGIYAHPSL